MYWVKAHNSSVADGEAPMANIWHAPAPLFKMCRALATLALLAVPVRSDASISIMEAIDVSLTDSPSLAIQKEAEKISRSAWLDALAPFDPQVSISGGYERDPATSQLKSYSSSVSISALAPAGLTFAPSLSFTGSTSLTDPAIVTSNTSTAAITIGIPLGAGLGHNMAWATRLYTKKSLDASAWDLEYAAASTAYKAASAYWNYLYSYHSLLFANTRRQSAEEQVQISKALAHAGEISEVKVFQATAFLHEQEQLVSAAKLALIKDWHALLGIMGISVKDREIPEVPEDSFPVPDSTAKITGSDVTLLTSLAMAKSPELHSKRLRLEAMDALVAGSRNRMRPKISLQLRASYSREHDGPSISDYFSSISGSSPGGRFSASLTYTLPLGNHSDEALLLKNRALYEQARIDMFENDRFLKNGIAEDLEWIRNLADAYESAKKSVDAYRFSKEAEMKKFRMGLSDITSLQTANDRLASAENTLNFLGHQYAISMLGVRLKTGTIVTSSGSGFSCEREKIFTLPSARK